MSNGVDPDQYHHSVENVGPDLGSKLFPKVNRVDKSCH